MEPHTLRGMSDGALHRLLRVAKRGRHHAERVWELALRSNHTSALVPYAQAETERWDRLHALVKAEICRRRPGPAPD